MKRIILVLFFSNINFNSLIAQEQRPFKIDDLFEFEGVGTYSFEELDFSKDGKKLAFVKTRAKKTNSHYEWSLQNKQGADIWVQLNRDEPPFKITNGLEDGSSWWSPLWSPDGTKLAFLSNRGENQLFVWVWNSITKELKPISKRNVELLNTNWQSFIWVDSRHILFTALADAELPEFLNRSTIIANRELLKGQTGKKTTSNILESGVPVDISKRLQNDLLLVNISDGTERIIFHGISPYWRISPDGKYIAFTKQFNANQPQADKYVFFDGAQRQVGIYKIGIINLDGNLLISKDLKDKIGENEIISAIQWSPNSTEIAFLGSIVDGKDYHPHLFEINIANNIIRERQLNDLDLPIYSEYIQWTDDNSLILLGSKKSVDSLNNNEPRREDWYMITKKGVVLNLTEKMKTSPGRLVQVEGKNEFICAADGDIWRIEAKTRKRINLTNKFEQVITGISWPAENNRADPHSHNQPQGTVNQIIFEIKEMEEKKYFLLNLVTGSINKVLKPDSAADLVAYEPMNGTTIFYKSDRSGLQVWTNNIHSNNFNELVKANTFLKNIEEGKFKKINYLSLNGVKLNGWIILPIGYEKGKHYPLLTYVYPGEWAFDDGPLSNLSSINSPLYLNLQIAASHGYAVLFPTMPLNGWGKDDDPMLRLSEGVLPAVDKAVEIGIADPERLFLMGHSFGGFATYGLVTQTSKFKAAIAMAGLTNLVSEYSTYGGSYRYTNNPQEFLRTYFWMFESGIVSMVVPPWKDLWHYMRNSPISYVDRVQTPLMIVQGDLDFVPIQQGEEFFNSLYRQGKRASFVRYWNEGHVLNSPANIRDLWSRIFSWFDEFGDIKRDEQGNIFWDGDKVMTRNGDPALKPGDFLKFSSFFDQDWGK